jgi:hypothetical protein
VAKRHDISRRIRDLFLGAPTPPKADAECILDFLEHRQKSLSEREWAGEDVQWMPPDTRLREEQLAEIQQMLDELDAKYEVLKEKRS